MAQDGQDDRADADEWEYEYDTQGTEDYYITLDLTTHVPPLQRRRVVPPSMQDIQDSIQVLDLHSDNPLIAHQDKIYSCHWTTAVGTDLLITLPGETSRAADSASTASASPDATPSASAHPSLRSTPDYTILAATPHRLVGVPSSRKPKTDFGGGVASLGSAAARPSYLHRSGQRNAQVEFLQKAQAVKAESNSEDFIPEHSSNALQRPRTVIRPFLAGTAAGASWGSSAASRSVTADSVTANTGAVDTDTVTLAQDDVGDAELDDDNGSQAPAQAGNETGLAETQSSSMNLTPSRRGTLGRRGRQPGRPGRQTLPRARENVIDGLVGDGLDDLVHDDGGFDAGLGQAEPLRAFAASTGRHVPRRAGQGDEASESLAGASTLPERSNGDGRDKDTEMGGT